MGRRSCRNLPHHLLRLRNLSRRLPERLRNCSNDNCVRRSRRMLKRFAALLFVACATNGASESDESWKNLGRTIKESDYTVATRDGHCVTGHVESFDEKSVTIKSVRLDRKDVIRVGDGTGTADHDPIYSGRSSWADLQHAEPNKYEHIRLHFKSGVTRNYHTFSASV